MISIDILGFIFFNPNLSEVLSVFQTFVTYIENQFSTGIKILRFNSSGEYISHEFHDFLHHKGIVSQRSCPYTPQQNGVAKCKNRHLLDVVRTLLLESFIPPKFWVEALPTAVYLINKLPSQVLNFDSPYLCLHHQHPSYLNLHTFGCVCFVYLPPHERHFFPSLLNVFLWVIVFLTKAMYVMILVQTNFVLLVMLFSLKINITFLPMLSPCLSLVFFLVIMNCLLS
jgi:hypothetical protein